MILQVFGETLRANVIEQDETTMILAPLRLIELLQDAHEIEEPVLVDEHLCLITFVGEPLVVARDSILEVVFDPLRPEGFQDFEPDGA